MATPQLNLLRPLRVRTYIPRGALHPVPRVLRPQPRVLRPQRVHLLLERSNPSPKVRNLSLQRKRSEGRRVRRERTAARTEALPSASELVEEMTVRREVADALLHLEEPYRSTLFLRFFRDFSLKRIAKESGVPISTVRSGRGTRRLWSARGSTTM